MPRYFFDVHANGQLTKDDVGLDLADDQEVRLEAIRALPAIARDEVVRDGDRQAYMVFVTDEGRQPVFSATVTYAGVWLRRD